MVAEGLGRSGQCVGLGESVVLQVKAVFIMSHDTARRNACEAVKNAPEGYSVTIGEPTRTLEQNARLWASLNEIAQQVVWHGRMLSAEDWKHIFTSSLKKLTVVPNLDGTGFVALGLSTSRMSKGELSELLELIYAFGAERGVIFNDMETA